MSVLAALILGAWFVVLIFAWALCRMAALSDRPPTGVPSGVPPAGRGAQLVFLDDFRERKGAA